METEAWPAWPGLTAPGDRGIEAGRMGIWWIFTNGDTHRIWTDGYGMKLRLPHDHPETQDGCTGTCAATPESWGDNGLLETEAM